MNFFHWLLRCRDSFCGRSPFGSFGNEMAAPDLSFIVAKKRELPFRWRFCEPSSMLEAFMKVWALCIIVNLGESSGSDVDILAIRGCSNDGAALRDRRY